MNRFLSVTLFCVLALPFLSVSQANAADEKWKLIWSDEFDKPGRPDPMKWEYEIGGGGWGNNEFQFYTDREQNSWVEDGHLVIQAVKEDYQNHRFTSARMRTKGPGWKYARVDVRAKVPGGQGTWPAIWMMPKKMTYSDTIWPDNGEIDILEHVGRDPETILGCFYTKNFNWMNGNGKTESFPLPTAVSEYHIYSLVWDGDQAHLEVDGVKYNVFKNPKTDWKDWPFDQNYYLILNMALGGYGGELDENIFPRKFLIDYVRIYQKE